MQLIRGEVVELHETQRELILLMILDRKRLMRANLRRHSQTAEFRPWPLLAEMVATLTTLRHQGEHKLLLEFYREALRWRRELARLTDLGRQCREVRSYEQEKLLWVQMQGEGEAVLLAHFGREELLLTLPWPAGPWRLRFNSAERRWQGPGSQAPASLSAPAATLRLAPQSLALYLREE